MTYGKIFLTLKGNSNERSLAGVEVFTSLSVYLLRHFRPVDPLRG